MQHTEKYQFNLIEGSDTFLPGALNENAEKAEEALAALAADTAARFAAQPRIHYLTWTGTGATSRTLTFPFTPKAVLLSGDSDGLSPCIVTYGQRFATRVQPYSTQTLNLSWAGTQMSFSGSDETIAFNHSGKAYFAVAIG